MIAERLWIGAHQSLYRLSSAQTIGLIAAGNLKDIVLGLHFVLLGNRDVAWCGCSGCLSTIVLYGLLRRFGRGCFVGRRGRWFASSFVIAGQSRWMRDGFGWIHLRTLVHSIFRVNDGRVLAAFSACLHF